jgi:hypothetical protein
MLGSAVSMEPRLRFLLGQWSLSVMLSDYLYYTEATLWLLFIAAMISLVAFTIIDDWRNK